MNARSVPSCFRGNVAVSLAYEDGARAGAMGLSRDVNPFGPYNQDLCSAWDEGWSDGRDTLTTDKEG